MPLQLQAAIQQKQEQKLFKNDLETMCRKLEQTGHQWIAKKVQDCINTQSTNLDLSFPKEPRSEDRKLKELPAEFGEILAALNPNLNDLKLSHNMLTNLQPLHGLQDRLTTLDVTDNLLPALRLNGFDKLTNLHIGNNMLCTDSAGNLKGLPDKLPNLQVFDAPDNGMTGVFSVTQFPKLKTLNLEKNHLSTLSGLDKENTLVDIKLQENRIKNLPLDPAGLNNLALDLSYQKAPFEIWISSDVPESEKKEVWDRRYDLWITNANMQGTGIKPLHEKNVIERTKGRLKNAGETLKTTGERFKNALTGWRGLELGDNGNAPDEIIENLNHAEAQQVFDLLGVDVKQLRAKQIEEDKERVEQKTICNEMRFIYADPKLRCYYETASVHAAGYMLGSVTRLKQAQDGVTKTQLAPSTASAAVDGAAGILSFLPATSAVAGIAKQALSAYEAADFHRDNFNTAMATENSWHDRKTMAQTIARHLTIMMAPDILGERTGALDQTIKSLSLPTKHTFSRAGEDRNITPFLKNKATKEASAVVNAISKNYRQSLVSTFEDNVKLGLTQLCDKFNEEHKKQPESRTSQYPTLRSSEAKMVIGRMTDPEFIGYVDDPLYCDFTRNAMKKAEPRQTRSSPTKASEQNATITRLNQEVVDLRGEVTGLENKVTGLEDKVTSMEGLIAALLTRLETLEANATAPQD